MAKRKKVEEVQEHPIDLPKRIRTYLDAGSRYELFL